MLVKSIVCCFLFIVIVYCDDCKRPSQQTTIISCIQQHYEITNEERQIMARFVSNVIVCCRPPLPKTNEAPYKPSSEMKGKDQDRDEKEEDEEKEEEEEDKKPNNTGETQSEEHTDEEGVHEKTSKEDDGEENMSKEEETSDTSSTESSKSQKKPSSMEDNKKQNNKAENNKESSTDKSPRWPNKRPSIVKRKKPETPSNDEDEIKTEKPVQRRPEKTSNKKRKDENPKTEDQNDTPGNEDSEEQEKSNEKVENENQDKEENKPKIKNTNKPKPENPEEHKSSSNEETVKETTEGMANEDVLSEHPKTKTRPQNQRTETTTSSYNTEDIGNEENLFGEQSTEIPKNENQENKLSNTDSEQPNTKTQNLENTTENEDQFNQYSEEPMVVEIPKRNPPMRKKPAADDFWMNRFKANAPTRPMDGYRPSPTRGKIQKIDKNNVRRATGSTKKKGSKIPEKIIPQNTRFCGQPMDRLIHPYHKENIAYLGEFPWMARLGYRDSKNETRFLCDGSLISIGDKEVEFVITSAQCLTDFGEFKLDFVRLGEYDTREDLDCDEYFQCTKIVDLPILNYISHEDWNERTMKNDIGIIQVDPIGQVDRYKRFIHSVCMPFQFPYFLSNRFSVAGWGTHSLEMPENNYILRTNTVLNTTSCFVCDDLSKEFCPLDESQTCVQGPVDVIMRGGGLLTDVSNYRDFSDAYILGIASFRPKLGESITIFTRIDHHLEWILKSIGKLKNGFEV